MRATITGPIDLESCVFRHRGKRHVTACATLRYRMMPEHSLAVLDGVGRRRAGDPLLVPFLARADVLFVGSAHAAEPVRERHVRFSVRGRSSVDRSLLVGGEAFVSRPVPELGPIGWHARFGAGAVLHKGADGIVTIPDRLDWDALQSAPPEQQCEWLRGDEWILLDGLHPTVDVLHVRLPGWAPRLAATFGGTRGLLAAHADRLVVLGDESAIALSWRASFEVPANVALDAIELGAFVEHDGALPQDEPRQATVHLGGSIAARPPRTVAPTVGRNDDEGTLLLADVQPESSASDDSWLDEATATASLTSTVSSPAPPVQGVTMPASPQGDAWPFELATVALARGVEPAAIPGAPWSRIDEEVPAIANRAVTMVLDRATATVAEPARGGRRRTDLRVVAAKPWAHAIVRDQVRPSRDSITLVVKASFDLAVDGSLTRKAMAEAPQGDRFDGRSRVTPTAPCELAPLKLEADVLLTAHAYAPKGSATVSEVRLRFGHRHARIDRRFVVVGPRSYRTTAGIVTGVTAPEPFDRVPLIHEHAFGGPELAANPVGAGHPSARRDGAWRLPRIEDPSAPIASPTDRPRPACPAPLPRAWRLDRPRRGEFDATWRKSIWPFRDAAFDPSSWQAAPIEQRLPELSGTEPFELAGVHSEARVISGELPGIAPAAFIESDGELTPLPVRLDTVLFDCDAMRVDLLWRGLVEVGDFDRPGFDRLVVVDAGGDAEARARDLSKPAAKAAPAPLPEREPGLDLRGQDLRGADYRNRDLRGALLRSADLSGACFAGADLTGADLTGAKLETIDLAGADLTGAKLETIDLAGADLTGAKLAEARLDGARLDDVVFDGALLAGASFVASRGERVSFTAADLRRARFDRAELHAARFNRARLDEASFEGALLGVVQLAGAAGNDAIFRNATLEDACADGASFERACFDGARLAGSVWSKADLRGASAHKADLRRAGLDDARCEGASFAGANLAEARLEAADCVKASFAGANLRAASLEKAILIGADLRGANLFRVATWRADLTGAKLDRAFTAGSRLS